MTPEKLDYLFPFFVLCYGFLLTIVLNVPALRRAADGRLPVAMNQQLKRHRGLALVCLVVGGYWSLQNIWLG